PLRRILRSFGVEGTSAALHTGDRRRRPTQDQTRVPGPVPSAEVRNDALVRIGVDGVAYSVEARIVVLSRGFGLLPVRALDCLERAEFEALFSRLLVGGFERRGRVDDDVLEDVFADR